MGNNGTQYTQLLDSKLRAKSFFEFRQYLYISSRRSHILIIFTKLGINLVTHNHK